MIIYHLFCFYCFLYSYSNLHTGNFLKTFRYIFSQYVDYLHPNIYRQDQNQLSILFMDLYVPPIYYLALSRYEHTPIHVIYEAFIKFKLLFNILQFSKILSQGIALTIYENQDPKPPLEFQLNFNFPKQILLMENL